MIDFNKYKNLFSEEEILFLNKIQEISSLAYKGLTRNDGVTEYIKHPEDIVDFLLNKLKCNDIICVSLAYLHDVLEESEIYKNDYSKLLKDMNEKLKNINWSKGNNEKEYYIKKIFYFVKEITFNKSSDNSFHKSLLKSIYIADVAKKEDIVLLVKVLDRLFNVLDFYNSKDYKYSKKYFTRGEVLFGNLYERLNELKEYKKCSLDSVNTWFKNKKEWFDITMNFVNEVYFTINNNKCLHSGK